MAIKSAESKFLVRLGLRLREIRQSKGWTLEQAEEHGYRSWRHLQKIEAGKNATIATLFRISQVYEIDFETLFKDL